MQKSSRDVGISFFFIGDTIRSKENRSYFGFMDYANVRFIDNVDEPDIDEYMLEQNLIQKDLVSVKTFPVSNPRNTPMTESFELCKMLLIEKSIPEFLKK